MTQKYAKMKHLHRALAGTIFCTAGDNAFPTTSCCKVFHQLNAKYFAFAYLMFVYDLTEIRPNPHRSLFFCTKYSNIVAEMVNIHIDS